MKEYNRMHLIALYASVLNGSFIHASRILNQAIINIEWSVLYGSGQEDPTGFLN